MTGTDYVIALDSLANYLDQRSSAIRLKLENATKHRMQLHAQFFRGQLDAVQAIKAHIAALRTGKTEEQVLADWHHANPHRLDTKPRELFE